MNTGPANSLENREWCDAGAMALCCIVVLAGLVFPGCRGRETLPESAPYVQAATTIEYPDLADMGDSGLQPVRPVSLATHPPEAFWDLTLEQAVQIALRESTVLRDLGGTLLQSPGLQRTTFDPALAETDPRFGPEAALAAFDANFAASLFYEKNDRALNNQFFGGGTRKLKQEAGVLQAQINKRTPYGSEFAIRHSVEYDDNNAPGNRFTAAWDLNFEAEFRQSLLQGAGIDFGRIAGTSRVPGLYNGILVARTNTDISLAEFELAVRDFVSDLETAYWNLYFAYRDLDAKIVARNASLATWRRVQALKERGRIGGEADKEAEAREQYYRFQEEVENALSGRLSGGAASGTGGVLVAERRLRYLMGLPINSDELIRTIDEPTRAEIIFAWELSLEESLSKRAELRRQKWMVKRRELELFASRNFLRPELDVVAQYRWRGFGRNFLRYDNDMQFSSAWDNLVHGDFQESQVGVELAFPFGNRQAHAGVRNAEFLLARSRAVLREQEQRVVHDLSNAISEIERAYRVLQTVYNRRDAARERVQALEAAFAADKAPLNSLLDAQRRLASAESHYYQSLIAYNDAVRNVHLQKGTLLEYVGIHLAEGPWPEQALEGAIDKLDRRMIIEGGHLPPHHVISRGDEMSIVR